MSTDTYQEISVNIATEPYCSCCESATGIISRCCDLFVPRVLYVTFEGGHPDCYNYGTSMTVQIDWDAANEWWFGTDGHTIDGCSYGYSITLTCVDEGVCEPFTPSFVLRVETAIGEGESCGLCGVVGGAGWQEVCTNGGSNDCSPFFFEFTFIGLGHIGCDCTTALFAVSA